MNDIYADFKFKDYRVLKISLDTNTEEKKEQSFDFEVKYSINENNRECIIAIEFELSENYTNITGEISGIFQYGDGIDETEFEQFIGNGLTILFPYLRAAVSSLSSIVNGEVLIVPTINVLEYIRKKFDMDKNKQDKEDEA